MLLPITTLPLSLPPTESATLRPRETYTERETGRRQEHTVCVEDVRIEKETQEIQETQEILTRGWLAAAVEGSGFNEGLCSCPVVSVCPFLLLSGLCSSCRRV